MLRINLFRLYKLRGVKNPYSFLRKNGFSRYLAIKYTKKSVQTFTLPDIDLLCQALKCSVDDIFEYVPEGNEPNGFALMKLVRFEPANDYAREIQNLPIDDLKVIDETIKNLKNKNNDNSQAQ